jgi:hypothetical protein
MVRVITLLWYCTKNHYKSFLFVVYKKERRPTALRREKREELRDTEGHQREGAGEKEETDREEAEGKEREEA